MTSDVKKRNKYGGPRNKPELRESEANCYSTISGAYHLRGKLQSQISQHRVKDSLFAADPMRSSLQAVADGAYE